MTICATMVLLGFLSAITFSCADSRRVSSEQAMACMTAGKEYEEAGNGAATCK
jgi:hypothetical protein